MTGKTARDIDIEIVCCHFVHSYFSLVLKGRLLKDKSDITME